mmetsp:Transcript_5767/g.14787  ORF Transcript_5767/g.14787 Transcript_5767/m.14787 type:complete len:549 (-) Transcript_5767:357-2003(-)
MMTTNVRNMRSIVTASSAVLVALLAVVVMLSAVSGVSADKSTTTTYETTKYVDEYNSGYYGDEYKSGYYPKYKWWAPWTWKYSSNKYNDNKYDSGYDSGYSKYDSGYGYSKYDSKYGVGPYYGKQYEQDEHYPCDTFYPKPKWYSPFTWKYRKYAKFDYYSGPCEVKKEEHCLPFWGHPDDASEATWYTVTHASGGGGCHGGAKNGCSTAVMGGDASTGGDTRRRQLLNRPNLRPLYETQYFYAKSEAHGLTFTLTNHYYYNEKWVCAIDDISRKNAICTMAGRFGGGYSTPEKCILTFKTHQKGGKCIPHHMALDCGKPPYVETSKFSKIDYRDIPHKDIIQQDLEGCTCDSSDNFLSGTAYTNCQSEPFEGEPITLFKVATDISGDPSAITVASFPCITTSSQEVDFSEGDFVTFQFPNLAEVRFANWVTGHSKFSELKDNIMSYWQRQIKSDEPAKEKTPDDEVHKAAARAAAIALAAKDVGTQQLNRRTFCKSCNQHVTDHTTITCPRGNGSGSRQCVHRRQQQPRIPRREPQEAGDWIVAPEF